MSHWDILQRLATYATRRSAGSLPWPAIHRSSIAPPRPHSIEPACAISEHRYSKIIDGRIKISIIYNYFAKAATIFQSLESLHAQSHNTFRPEQVEIILIDDGTMGEDVAERLPENVTYLWQRKQHYGICRAKNTGAKLANGDILVFLDPDITVSPGYLDAAIDAFRAFGPRAVLCGYIWDYHFAGCPDPRTEFGVWERPGQPTRRFYQLAGGNMAITRELFSETAGFDEDLIYGGVEDLLFGYHIGKLPNTSVVFLPGMEGRHIPHPPSPAHADPQATWAIVRRKWPDFYRDYITLGIR